MTRKKYPYYPIYIDLENRDVLIVGGGNVCARKAETMLRYGAKVTIVSREVNDEIGEWEKDGKVTVHLKAYDASDLTGRSIVIASTDDPCVNARVARDCRRSRIPVNVVDVTHLCEFIVPSIVEQGSIQVAISTGGKSPAIARTLRERLQQTIGAGLAEANDLLGSLRSAAKKTLPTDVDRKRFFDGILEAGFLDLMSSGKRREACELLAQRCRESGVPISRELSSRLGPE
ncbi:MAG TPA: bifunctional precorrin-2 dehydrogenase/sirohydrochlorin ferrochelatase [Thermoanaerobaculia bacterium]|nr:bifunctional precorrin-2 dehydrogenase/sirohydrochlorin ferrochelatase [Thermoanaerobaculia bacterium]